MNEIYRPLPIELTPGIRSLHERVGSRETRERNPQTHNTAKHELQHAIAANFNIVKLSVVPEGNSLGHTELLPMSFEAFSVSAAAGSLGSDARGFSHDFYQIDRAGVLTISSARSRARALVEQYHPTLLDRAAEMISVLQVASREDVLAVLELAKHELEQENVDLTTFPEDYLQENVDLYMLFGEDVRNAQSIRYQKDRYIIITKDGKQKEKLYCQSCHATSGHKPFCSETSIKPGNSEKDEHNTEKTKSLPVSGDVYEYSPRHA